MTDRELLRAQILRHEGLRLVPYRDSLGFLTVGVGYNISARGWEPLERVLGRKIDKNDPRLTREEALLMLDADLDTTEREVGRRWPWTSLLAPARRRAVLDMAFNLGVSGLANFRQMLAALRDGDYLMAEAEALDSKWRTDVGPIRSREVAEAIRTGVDA